MQKILVTGANGFVGQHLCRELAENNYDVMGLGGPNISLGVSDHLAEYQNVDLTDAEAVQNVDFSKVDAVVHLAGLAAVGPSFDQPLKYITSNIGMEINLYEAMLKQNVHPKFLVISSGSLYDPKAELPLNESSPVVPSSPYAVSKLGQEQMAAYYGNRGFEYVIARPFNHAGPGQGPGFLLPDLAKQIAEAEKSGATEIKVGNLEARRDYTDVRDIVRAYRLLIESGKSGHTYNICTGESRSGTEILDMLLDLSSADLTVTPDQARMRPSDTPDIFGSHDQLTDHTGWKPDIDIHQTIEDTIEYWRGQPSN